MISIDGGETLVKWARKAISYYLATGKTLGEFPEGEVFKEKRGIFVTLKNSMDNSLRGCIGYPLPDFSLGEAVVKAAVSAAFKDPRFSPVSATEFEDLKLEVSVLTVPKLFRGKKEDLPFEIEIGKHGLLIERGPRSGLLLPQVPIEWKWAQEQFLDEVSQKAGLLRTAWMQADTDIYLFEAQIFEEQEPRGIVIEKR